MKNITVFATVAIAATSFAQAQVELISGADFGFRPEGNYSDLANDLVPFGSVTFQDGPNNFFPATQYSDVNVAAGALINSDFRIPTVNDEFAFSGGSILAEDGFASAEGGFIEYSVDTSNFGTYDDFTFAFGIGSTAGGTNTVDVSYDAGAGFVGLGQVSSAATQLSGGEALSVSTGLIGATDTITFRIDFTDLADGSGAYFDNLQISGVSVVPEPSTYAAIAGVLALGVVAYRRRK